MVQRIFTRLCVTSIVAAALSLAGWSSASAQGTASGLRVEDEIRGVLGATREPGPVYQINLRGWGVGLPGFLVSAFFDEFTTNWEDGPNFGYGAELLIRDDVKRRELVIGLDYADLSTPDGWWLQNNQRIREARWVENDLRLISAEVGFRFVHPLTDDNRFQAYYGAGVGAGLVLGTYTKYRIQRTCIPEDRTRDSSLLQQGSPCWPGDDPLYRPETREDEQLLPIMPFLNIGAGMRYLIADAFVLGAEFGFRTYYAYAGLTLGFAWQTWIYQ